VDIVTHNQQAVQCEVLTDSGQTVEDSSGPSDTEPKTVQCDVLTESGQILEDSSGHSDPDPTGCKLCGTDRHWTKCRRQHWT